jgi:HEAT repeat protein
VETPEVLGALRIRKEVTLSEILYEAFGREHQAKLDLLGPEDASPEEKAEAIQKLADRAKSVSSESRKSYFESHSEYIEKLYETPDAHYSEIVEALKADCSLSRGFAVALLGKCAIPEARALLNKLRSDDPASLVRSYALAALGNGASDAEIALLVEVLNSPRAEEEAKPGWDSFRRTVQIGAPHDVRAGAAEGLGNAKARSAVEPLLARLSEDSSPLLQSYAVRALGEVGDPRAIEPLKRLLAILESYSEMRRQTLSNAIARALDQLAAS